VAASRLASAAGVARSRVCWRNLPLNISAAPFAPRIAPLTVLLFLGLQGADATLAAAWGVLALGALVSGLCGMLALQRPLSRIEWGMLGVVGACALSIAFGVDARHSLQ